MSATAIPNSFIPDSVNTPLDVRSFVQQLSDAYAIQNPCLGGIFYCAATQKHYYITGLKAKTIGPLSVSDAAVDTFQELAEGTPQDTSYQTFDTVFQNKTYFKAARVPIGVKTNKDNYYPVVAGSVVIGDTLTSLDVTHYLAEDSQSEFQGVWTAYFSQGYNESSITTQFNNYYVVSQLPSSDSLSQYPDGSFFIVE